MVESMDFYPPPPSLVFFCKYKNIVVFLLLYFIKHFQALFKMGLICNDQIYTVSSCPGSTLDSVVGSQLRGLGSSLGR